MKRFLPLANLCLLSLVVVLFSLSAVFGQVGIGTDTPNNRSILELNSSTKGFLPPRMDNAGRAALGALMTATEDGMVVYDTQDRQVYFWNGNTLSWVSLTDAAGLTGSGTANKLTKWTGAASLGDSQIEDNGATLKVGAGATEASAILQLNSTTQGILIPRMTTLQRNAIASPVEGLMVYNTSVNRFQYHNGTVWVDGLGLNVWRHAGNANTNPANDFLGTTDAQPLVIRTNNTEQMRITSAGLVGIGTAAPLNRLDAAGGAVLGAGYAGAQTAPSNGLLVQGVSGFNMTGGFVGQVNIDAGGNNYGLYSQRSGLGAAVYGLNSNTATLNRGVEGETQSIVNGSSGVQGVASGTTGFVMGVLGTTASNSGAGVRGSATSASGTTYGVYGSVNSTDATAAGVYGVTATAASGVKGESNGTGVAIEGVSANATAGKFSRNSTSATTPLVQMDITNVNDLNSVLVLNNINSTGRLLQANANGTQRLVLEGTGFLGIGNITPTERLHVNGNIRMAGALMPNNLPGSVGQVLTSAGAGAPPTWQTFIGLPSGILGNTLRHNGTNWLADNTLYNNGTNVGVGVTSGFTGRLQVRSGGGVHGIVGQATTAGDIGVLGEHSTNGTGVKGQNLGGASGYGVEGLATGNAGVGVSGYASSTTGFTLGVSGVAESSDGIGVFGYATSVSGSTFGVQGVTESNNGMGVYGASNATTGSSHGVYGYTGSASGYGVFGLNAAGGGTAVGVYGESTTDQGIGVQGINNSATGTTYGVQGRAASTSGIGVLGRATGSSGTNYGVRGETSSPNGYGVYGESNGGYAGYFTRNVSGAAQNLVEINIANATDNRAALAVRQNSTANVFQGFGGGNQFFTMTATGRLGVGAGTASPNYTIDANGVINAATGYRVNNTAAAAGTYLRGDGTNFVASTIQAADLPGGLGSTWNRTSPNVYLAFNTDKVGVGATSPGAKLTIQDGNTATGSLDILEIIRDNSAGAGADNIGGSIMFRNKIDNSGLLISGRINSIMEDANVATNVNSALGFDVNVDGTMTNALYLNGNARVGIGTTNPLHKFEVRHVPTAAYDVQMRLYNPNNASNEVAGLRLETASGWGVQLQTKQNGNWLELTNNAGGAVHTWNADSYYPGNGASYLQGIGGHLAMMVGRVGIGTNTPDHKLVVDSPAGTDPFVVRSSGSGYLRMVSGGKVGIGSFFTPLNALDIDGGVVMGNTYKGTVTAPASGLLVEGSVGIGITNPAFRFVVSGVNNIANNQGQITAYQNANNGNAYYSESNSNGTPSGSPAYARAMLSGYNANLPTGAGNVGVWGICTGSGAGGYGVIAAYGNTYNAPTTYAALGGAIHSAIFMGGNVGIGTNAPAYQLELSLNSAAKPTTNTWTAISDARLKKDVTPYHAGLSDLLKINPVWFTYTGEAGLPQDRGVGVLAQDLQKIAPYMVNTWKYRKAKRTAPTDNTTPYNANESFEETEYLGVDNGAMTYMLVNAVKEQQALIETLQTRIQTLENPPVTPDVIEGTNENRILKLETEVKELREMVKTLLQNSDNKE